MSWKTVEPVAESFEVVAHRRVELQPKVEQTVDAIWQRTKAERGDHLFDAPLLFLEQFDARRLVGRWASYRLYVAKRAAPETVGLVGLTAVGVSGLCVAGDSLVLARRSHQVTAYPGYWELAPAGSIDDSFWTVETGRVDVVAQVVREFEEELGLSRRSIVSHRVLGLVRDEISGCCDVCIRLNLAMDGDTLRRRLAANGSSEYDQFKVASPAMLRSFIDSSDARLLPTSAALLAEFLEADRSL